jgi:hypothetical protein
MSAPRPAAKITLEGVARSMPEAAVASLRVELALAGAHDRVDLALWPGSDFASAAPGDKLSVALGFGDALQDVFAGVVEAVDAVPGGVLLEALSTSSELSRARVAQAYLAQTVAEVVRDLIDRAGATAGTIDAPAKLAVYHVDERRSIWSHLCDLAALSGCDLTSDAQGAVCFAPPRRGAADRRLRYGAELHSWRVGARRALPEPLPVLPHGAASENGREAWHQVLRFPDGESPSGASLVHALVRDRDLARTVAAARNDACTRAAVGGELAIAGDAGLRPGALLELADLPGGDPGPLRVLAVTHLFDAANSFRSTLRTEAAE